MKNSDGETKMESYRKRQVAQVQKGRQKRRKELERLQQFYRYIEKTDPNDNTESESSTIALQEEMCRTYNRYFRPARQHRYYRLHARRNVCHTYSVHLEEFDYNLFEGLYDEHLKI